jgi:cytochrome c-type biogenesis protein CcmH/NrfG
MAIEQTTAANRAMAPMLPWRVYSMALIYLVAGLAIGYLLRASRSPIGPVASAAITNVERPKPGMPSGGNPPTLDQMKQMADRQAAPLLAKLKSDPNNSALLMQLGAIYHSTHQFQQAADFYDKAAQVDSKNIAARTQLAISLYRSGDADGAIAQLNRTLRDDPGDANSLFNLGMIRLQAKHDKAGAIAAWRQLLKTNPQLSDDRKAEVQKLMADVQASPSAQHRSEGVRSSQ